MTCIVGKNKITCYTTSIYAKGRIRVKDGSEYWCNLRKEIYDVLKDDAVVSVYSEDGTGINYSHIDKKFIKSFTTWVGTVEEYLKRLEVEADKRCEEAKEGLKLTNDN
jgi:hypothetical protein